MKIFQNNHLISFAILIVETRNKIFCSEIENPRFLENILEDVLGE